MQVLPLGVLNRKTYENFLNNVICVNGGVSLDYLKRKRLKDLQGAINRYSSDCINIDIEWILEYNEILNYFKTKK